MGRPESASEAGSLSLRAFLDVDVTEATPNHSTLSRTRRLIDVETHVAVFRVDATTLESNAAMRSIERRDTEEFARGVRASVGEGHRGLRRRRARSWRASN